MKTARRGGLRAWVAALGLLALAAWAQAQPLSLKTMLRTPDFRDAVLSPNGQYVAVLVPVEARTHLVIFDLQARKVVNRINIPAADVSSPAWVGNDRLVFAKARHDVAMTWRWNTGGLFMVSRDGTVQRRLVPTFQDQALAGYKRYVSAAPAGPQVREGAELVVAMNDRDRESVDLYRFNIDNGDRKLLTRERPPRTTSWLLDRNGVPRVAQSSVEKSTETITWWRATPTGPWTELWRANSVSGDMMVPLHVESDGRHLLVASNAGRDTMAIYRYDPATRERQALLAEHPTVDLGADAEGEYMGDLVYDPRQEEIVGLRVDGGGRPQTIWLDERHARLQKLLDGALPGFTPMFQRAADAPVTLVASYADQRSPRWHLLNESTGQMEPLFVAMPWLDNGQLAAMTPFTYTTRDGLGVPAFHILPQRRKAGEPLPTVVLIHGGPWAQPARWAFHSSAFQEAQMLAAQGYAVLMPNFRGTTGLGRKLYQSSRGEWGKRMQEDLEDAVDWAVAQGITDPARVCLSGASYGGYAALMGLVKTPDKYRCAIAGMPVTDLPTQISSGWSDISRDDEARQYWIEMVGDPARDAEALAAASPARQAARIKGQVMLYGGVDDGRTPIEQMDLMRAALRANKQEPRWLAKYGEGHGFGSLDNVLETYGEKFEFLRQNLHPTPPRSQQAPAPEAPAAAQ